MANDRTVSWINPIGGHGDTLMISGVLKLVLEAYPEKRFNLVRRTSYLAILKGHPAIAGIGFPPRGAPLQLTSYWAVPDFDKGNIRAFQALAGMFGLKTPVPEKIYVPEIKDDSHRLLLENIPWRSGTVVIAPSSCSPRKAMAPQRWHELTERLTTRGAFVIQLGEERDVRIKNAYSLLGLTTPMEALKVIGKADLVVTSDSFFVHAAHYAGVPAITLWGPTSHKVYGYEGQHPIQAPVVCDIAGGRCITSTKPNVYSTQCQFNFEGHCMNRISIDEIMDLAGKYL
jgi:ADP-heptose:LPS heptosyltransferase